MLSYSVSLVVVHSIVWSPSIGPYTQLSDRLNIISSFDRPYLSLILVAWVDCKSVWVRVLSSSGVEDSSNSNPNTPLSGEHILQADELVDTGM